MMMHSLDSNLLVTFLWVMLTFYSWKDCREYGQKARKTDIERVGGTR